MSDVIIYHPGTGLRETVPEEAMAHLRVSGWVLLDEHNANEAEREKRQAAEAKASKKGDQ